MTIPFLVILEVWLSSVYPPVSILQFLAYFVPLPIFGGWMRDDRIKENWSVVFAFVFIDYVLISDALIMIMLASTLNRPLLGNPLYLFCVLLGALLILAMLYAIFREAKRAQS